MIAVVKHYGRVSETPCFQKKSPEIVNYYGGSKLLCHSIFVRYLVHQNRTITIASDFRVDGAKSPEIPQKEGVSGSKIAA